MGSMRRLVAAIAKLMDLGVVGCQTPSLTCMLSCHSVVSAGQCIVDVAVIWCDPH